MGTKVHNFWEKVFSTVLSHWQPSVSFLSEIESIHSLKKKAGKKSFKIVLILEKLYMINRGDRVYTVYTEDTIFLLTSAFLQAIEILSTTRILMLGSISFCCTALPRNFCKLSQLLLELFITPRPPTIVVLTNELSRGCTHKNSLLLFMVVSYNLRQSKKP